MSYPMVRLADICEINIGKTPSRNISKYWGSGFCWLSIADMKQGKNITWTKEQITDLAIKETNIKIVRAGTVLFSFKLSIGKVSISTFDLYTNEAIAALPIKDKSKLSSNYLMHALKALNFSGKSDNAVMGATLNKKKLSELTIPLPPIEEQNRISSILDKVEDIYRKRENSIELLDCFLQSLFIKMFGTLESNIHNFPIGTIRDLIESANYGTSEKASETQKKYPILRMGNITYQGHWDFSKMKYIDLDEKSKEKFIVRKGDLLFNRTNSKELVGKTAVFESDEEMAYAGYLVRIRANEIGNNYYISGYLNSAHGKSTFLNMCKSIVGMANINAQELQNIKILMPPKELQYKYEYIYKSVRRKAELYVRSKIELERILNTLSNNYLLNV